MLTIELPAEMDTRLTMLVEATNKPKSFYICEALERSLEDIEDAHLADMAYTRFLAGGKKSAPLAEVERRLGLAD